MPASPTPPGEPAPTLAASGLRVVQVARLVYGVAAAPVGAMVVAAGDLGAVFQPVPRWIPLHRALAYASGSLLVAGGLALLVPKRARAGPTIARLGALVLTADFLVWLLLLNAPTTATHASVMGAWEGCGLNMAVLAGAWILLARSDAPRGLPAHLLGERGVTLARRIFALGVPLVGLAHFADAQGATEYVPAWFPLRIDWVYLTGAGHIAAGLAILFGVVPVLAATLEAAQITAFVVISHIPAVVAAPTDRVQWGMLIYAVAIAASAWIVAATVPS
ncbi:MAG TPA: hypothetical protein VIY73_02105, partial [Polyangiaceae bacterium]